VSSYERMSRSRKFSGPQHGLKRLILRDRSAVGYPKVAEVWLPENKWHSCDVAGFVTRFKKSCSELLGIDIDLLDLEV